MQVQIRIYLGGADLGLVPVVSGSWKVTDEADVTVPGTVEFSVPATDEWTPTSPEHPLAGVGQRCRVQVDGQTWGWYRLSPAVRSGAVIRVTGVGLLREVERARFTQSWQTMAGQTRGQVVRQLLAGILPVVVLVPDSVLPIATWAEDRLGALYEVVESWPARIEIRDQAARILPPWPTSGPAVGGLALTAPLEPQGAQDDPFNGYRVSTIPGGDEQPVTAFWAQPDGPMRWGGPYGQHPGFFSSPLLTADQTQLLAIAERMTRRQTEAAASFRFRAVPDPARRVGDFVTVQHERQKVSGVGRITSLSLTRSDMSGLVVMV